MKKPSKCTQRRKILPEFEHVDHVEVNDIKNFHGLIITHRAEQCSLRTDGDTLDHTYMPETKTNYIQILLLYILWKRNPLPEDESRHVVSCWEVVGMVLLSCFRRFAERLLTDVITGHLPKWLRKCLTNSTPSSSFFFQNFTCPSWLAVMIKSVLGW